VGGAGASNSTVQVGGFYGVQLVSNSGALSLTQAGNVGIGTTTPGRTLSVVGDIRATGILYDSNNSAGTSGNFLMTTGTGYQWTSTSTLFGGNQVTGNGTNGYVTRWTAANTISTGVLLDNGTVAGVNATSSSYTFNVQANPGTAPFNVSSSTGTSLVTVTQTGNVGIGTSTPGSRLDIWGNVNIATGSTPTLFANTANGYVGIGTSNPAYPIDVQSANPVGGQLRLGSVILANDGGFLYLDRSNLATNGVYAGTKGLRTDGNLMVGANGAQFLVNATTNTVGINTTTTTSTLTIQGTGSINPFSVASSTGTQLLTVAANGNVGIGTAAPTALLQAGGTVVDGTSILALSSANGPFKFVAQTGPAMIMQSNDSFNIYGIASRVNGVNHADAFWLGSSVPIVWASTTGWTESVDIGLSRGGAGKLYLGNGTSGDFTGTFVAGNIGVGTTTPSQKLVVAGDIRATGILYDSNNSAGTSGNFLMTTGTGYQWTSTSTLFGSNQVTGSGTNGYVTRWTAANTVSTGVILDNGTVAGVNATSSTIAFNIQGTSSLDPLQVGTSTNTGMFIVKGNSGNVGVGSSNPGAKLDVQSSVSGVTGININSTAAAALAWSGNGTLYGSLSYAAATTTAVRATAGNALALGANGVDGYLNIVPGGNVGIGTTNPSQFLDVRGNTYINPASLALTDSQGSALQLK
jgi:hypothetical protein